MNLIYCPIRQNELQIQEFDFGVLDLIDGIPGKLKICCFVIGNKKYEVNIGGIRYHVIKNNLRCSCCGIKATRCFLEINKQASKERGVESYAINFYAETKNKNCESYMTLMTVDHIVAKFNGGSESFENCQTLCYNCNVIKDTTDFSVRKIRSILFPAYRAYISSVVLNKAKELTKPTRGRIYANTVKIESIQKALNIVALEKHAKLKQKIVDVQKENEILIKKCDEFETQAQINGFCPDEFV